MIYEHPLAYVLGLEGLALLRSFTGEHDRAFVEARLAEIRGLLADESLADAGVEVARVDTVEGYRIWSETYDGPNSAFDFDEPIVTEIVDALPVGVALDAACGTGRLAAALAERGHRILGVDSSPDMLARAGKRVPDGEFRLGDLNRLPVPDDAVDLVVCSLALAHVPSLEPVLAEFARVLRPGGHLVISDIHPEGVARGIIPPVRLPDGRPGRVATYHHRIGDYVRAALRAGLHVRRCDEPRTPAVGRPQPQDPPREPATPGPWELWPWSLVALAPDAAKAAIADVPAIVVWHFQLS
ncbi:class I SAM-dependent methyltransferase [Nonomuraea sp. K274]|uniref:Class I SAM-dependent methyltransferase n=1 Tax=Nonomuraea cypriaca TaxID=1187855 RepID=A0A931EZ38_9ACTN|nr:class I SAM-dependent methyltransferase [Nonomuraea cypriaca]MBF8187147.1 class I SAM-dependent methyltransferase [Nonomuraea cypriaca]